MACNAVSIRKINGRFINYRKKQMGIKNRTATECIAGSQEVLKKGTFKGHQGHLRRFTFDVHL